VTNLDYLPFRHLLLELMVEGQRNLIDHLKAEKVSSSDDLTTKSRLIGTFYTIKVLFRRNQLGTALSMTNFELSLVNYARPSIEFLLILLFCLQ
jgi:hypothetical protein